MWIKSNDKSCSDLTGLQVHHEVEHFLPRDRVPKGLRGRRRTEAQALLWQAYGPGKKNFTSNSWLYALKSNLINDKEVTADHLGPEWAGYVVRVTGGNDKQGFPMKQGKSLDSQFSASFWSGVLIHNRVKLLLKKGHSCYNPGRTGERKRKSVRGCIVNHNLSILNLAIVKKGEGEIEGLTDKQIPRRLGPKRANNIRKLFSLEKSDPVTQYVIRRTIEKEGKKAKSVAPKIQRLITPVTLQRKRRRMADKVILISI